LMRAIVPDAVIPIVNGRHCQSPLLAAAPFSSFSTQNFRKL
jgi:hypothetical protein